MIINKLKVLNFKKFSTQEFEFNKDINIIVGDNESGKSSILEALEICLNCTYRGKPLSAELNTDLFNYSAIEKYLKSDFSQEKLPEVCIEVFTEGAPALRGTKNRSKIDAEGIFVRLCFDDELAEAYSEFIKDPQKVKTLPVEFYKIEWYSFAWKRIVNSSKPINCLFVDPSRLHPTYGRTKYINKIINSALEKSARSSLNLNFRQLKAKFDEEDEVVEINRNLDSDNQITSKDLKITADIATTSSWESNLQLAVDQISFSQIGKGEQSQIQIKLAMQNRAKDIDVILLEEPENHLSHINLVRLINHIEKKNQNKQLFLTTHSSYVLNKLSLDKLCLLGDRYIRFCDVNKRTVKTLKRLPGYDTLRVLLAGKVILVEGPSDELLLKKIYLDKHKCLPEENGIDIIVVRGIGFKNFLNIAAPIEHPVRVVKDNDGNRQNNIIDWVKDYEAHSDISCYSPEDDIQYSLEPALIEANSGDCQEIDRLAKIMLSTQTFDGGYSDSRGLKEKKAFLIDWFDGAKNGARKVDSAMRIFETDQKINYPKYLVDVLSFNE